MYNVTIFLSGRSYICVDSNICIGMSKFTREPNPRPSNRNYATKTERLSSQWHSNIIWKLSLKVHVKFNNASHMEGVIICISIEYIVVETIIVIFNNFKVIKKSNQLHALSRTQRGRQRETSVKSLRSPLSAEFWRHCVLSGGTQSRALPRHHIEEMIIWI